MSDFTPQACPHCTHPTTPDNVFPVSNGSAYHVLCYQAAVIESGQPDPFPLCTGCQQMVWQHDADGLRLVVRGLHCVHNPETGADDWLVSQWHPECAPPDEDDEQPVEAVAEPAELVDTPALPQDFTAEGKPICPRCGKEIKRSPTPFNDIVWHKTCAALEQVASLPAVDKRHTRRNPRCPLCERSVRADPVNCLEERKKDIETDDGKHYHRACYRKSFIAAGEPDPFPNPDPKAVKARFDAGKEKAAKARKEATVVCGICNEKILRSAFADHIVPCAEKTRAEALAAVEVSSDV